MVRGQHPLYHVCNSSKNVSSRPKTKWKHHVHVVFIPPFHLQRPKAGDPKDMNSNIAIGACHIKHYHQGARASGHDATNTGVNCNVLDWKEIFGMPSSTLWPSGDERSRLRHHFPGRFLFGTTPKRVMYKSVKGGEVKGPTTRPCDTSVAR